MKKIFPMFALLAFAVPAGVAMAETDDPSLPVDSRIKILIYDESDVYTITTKYGYQTNLVFAPQEELQTISMGDRSLWQIIPSGNRLFIRPMDVNVTTNMTILTNKRSYQFDLVSLSEDDEAKPLYVAQFRYPEDEHKKRRRRAYSEPSVMHPPAQDPPAAAGFRPVEPPAAPVPSSAAPATPNYNYTYSGPDTLAPVQVFDDGKSTFIKHRDAATPLPAISVRGADGKERPVTAYVKEEQMIINEVAGEILLKHGDQTVAVYNEVLNPR